MHTYLQERMRTSSLSWGLFGVSKRDCVLAEQTASPHMSVFSLLLSLSKSSLCSGPLLSRLRPTQHHRLGLEGSMEPPPSSGAGRPASRCQQILCSVRTLPGTQMVSSPGSSCGEGARGLAVSFMRTLSHCGGSTLKASSPPKGPHLLVLSPGCSVST